MDLSFSLPTDDAMLVKPDITPGKPRELLIALPEEGHYLLVLDNTSAEKFTSCPTAARNYLVYKREERRNAAPLIFGGAIHKGLEALFKGKTLDEACQSIVTFYTNNPIDPEDYRTCAVAINTLKHYAMHSAVVEDYTWSILSDSSGIICERPFELPLGVLEVNSNVQLPGWTEPRFVSHIHVAWSGRIDLVANCSGANRVIDNKTSSISDARFFGHFQLSNQTNGYVWAAQQLWPELNITGFGVNVISLKRPSGSGALLERGPRGGESALKFMRAYYDYTPERTVRWANNALMIVENFVACLINRDGTHLYGQFPMHTAACFNKFGQCGYHTTCTIDDPFVELHLLNSDAFKTVTWNPVDE